VKKIKKIAKNQSFDSAQDEEIQDTEARRLGD